MTSSPVLALSQHFAQLEDPRVERTRLHHLLDIVIIAICAVIAGAESWNDLALFGETKYAWFSSFLALPNGIPSHDTFNRVFAALDPNQFRASFACLCPGDAAQLAAASDCPRWQDGVRVAGPLSGEGRHPHGERLGQH
jgi:hypothetical protein